MRYCTKESSIKKSLSPDQKVRRAILANRLKVAPLEADRIVKKIVSEVADILGIPEFTIEAGAEFAGRSLDLIFTINRQNTPKSNK